MNEPSILFIAASCYPIDGAEANVNAKVVKTLTEAGCTVDLVSRKSQKSLCYPKSIDDYYFGKIRNLEEVDWYIKKDLKRIWNHFKVYFKTGYTYVWADWAYPAIKRCEELIRKNHYDYIYSFNAPSELVALYLHKKYGIKWVATWNDPYSWNKYPAPYGKGPNGNVSYFRNKLIRNIGKNVYRNIFPSERLRDYMLNYMENMTSNTCVICPHIVLKEQLKNIENIGDSVLRIIHAGALGKERDPITLLQGLKEFLNINSDAKIQISFLGVFERSDGGDAKEYIASNNLADYVKMLPPVTYRDSLGIISKNDVCLIVEAPCKEGIFLPSKLADYMQLNKPIFAISPAIGTLNDMYKSGQIGYFANVTDYKEVSNTLCRIYNDYIGGYLKQTDPALKFIPSNYIQIQQKKIWK